MLSIACAIAILGPSVQFNIPVRNGRPSRIVEMMRGTSDRKGVVPSDVMLAADDPGRMIHVQGSAEEVLAVRQYVRLLDVERPLMQVKMHIESAVDRLGYDVMTSVRSNKKWKMTDEETGLTVGFTPRVNSDSTITLSLLIEYPGGRREQILRLKDAQKYAIDLGDGKSVMAWQDKEGNVDATMEARSYPKLTFEITSPKGKG